MAALLMIAASAGTAPPSSTQPNPMADIPTHYIVGMGKPARPAACFSGEICNSLP